MEAKILDYMFGGVLYSPPSILYIGLYSALPDDTGGGTELSGDGYARCPVNNDLVNWPTATGTTDKTNGTIFTFPAATAGWPTVIGIGIFDSSTGGNMLYYSDITPVSVSTGDIVRILAGGITVTSD